MDGFQRNPKGTFAADIPQEIKMRDLLYSKKPVIKSTIGDVKITIQFSNQETQGLRESIVSALTVSYEQRIQGQLSQLLASLEPEQTAL